MLGLNDHADPNLPALHTQGGATPAIGETQARTTAGVAVSVGQKRPATDATARLTISVNFIVGGPLSEATIVRVNAVAAETPVKWRRGIAYESEVKVGRSLAWRANNPGNLRDASTKIGRVAGGVGSFAVFATMEDGRAAQRSLYLNTYGALKVRDAVEKLTPPSENDTVAYLARLKKAGVDLDKDVTSQIDVLMPAIAANEGLIAGSIVPRQNP